MSTIVKTRIEVYLNGRKIIEASDTEPPDPDLQRRLSDGLFTAFTQPAGVRDLCRCITKNGDRQPTFSCPVHPAEDLLATHPDPKAPETTP